MQFQVPLSDLSKIRNSGAYMEKNLFHPPRDPDAHKSLKTIFLDAKRATRKNWQRIQGKIFQLTIKNFKSTPFRDLRMNGRWTGWEGRSEFPDTELVNNDQKGFKYQQYFELDELKGT